MLSKILKQLRKSNKKTQKEIALNLNISRVNYNRYETGEREPNYEILKHISNYFNVSLDYLLGETDIKEKLYKIKLNKLLKIECDLIKKYRILDKRGKMRVNETIKSEYKFIMRHNNIKSNGESQ